MNASIKPLQGIKFKNIDSSKLISYFNDRNNSTHDVTNEISVIRQHSSLLNKFKSTTSDIQNIFEPRKKNSSDYVNYTSEIEENFKKENLNEKLSFQIRNSNHKDVKVPNRCQSENSCSESIRKIHKTHKSILKKESILILVLLKKIFLKLTLLILMIMLM